MKVNIYYGGRGVMDDPTWYVLTKMEEVLSELRVTTQRFNLFEQKNIISTLPQTMRDADAVIFATTVEWLGLGGYMHQFLDACWLYGDKEKISRTYMQPIVMSTTYGEKEAMVTLENAWEILGGLPCAGFCGYVDDLAGFEANEEFSEIIAKRAENLYRTVSHKIKSLPNSNQAISRSVAHTLKLPLTPQESERLSEYVSDDEYVRQQKEDIKALTARFKQVMDTVSTTEETEFISDLKEKYRPENSHERLIFDFIFEEKKKILEIRSFEGELKVSYIDEQGPADAYIRLKTSVMRGITEGRMSFQRAFMTGEFSVKGNFKVIGMLDQLFAFQ